MAKVIHWRVVGFISEGAEKWVKEAGGQVLTLNLDPRMIAVGLAYDSDGGWSWSHGRQQHRQGLEFWNTGELQEMTSGITLQYRAIGGNDLAEYASVTDAYFLLPDEELDPKTMQVSGSWLASDGDIDYTGLGELPELDDHPF